MNKGLWYLSLFLTLLGVGCLVSGLALYAWIHDNKRMKGHAAARVVDFELKSVSKPRHAQFQNAYYPVIEFYANGFLYKKTLETGFYPSPYKEGDTIEVDYDLSDPNRFRISVRSVKEKAAWILCRVGIALTAIGIFFFIRFAVRG